MIAPRPLPRYADVTYIAAAIGMVGKVPESLAFVPTLQVTVASSFDNRVTPANVGGMALIVCCLQKAGIPPAEAVTGVALNLAAGGVVDVLLPVVFLAWARKGPTGGFSVPGSGTRLAAIPIVLAVVGGVSATRRGRRFVRVQVVPSARESLSSIADGRSTPV